MLIKDKNVRRKAAVEKELLVIQNKEEKMKKAASEQKTSEWKVKLQNVIPEKVYNSLEAAFGKAFLVVFEKGTAVIEKSYSKEKIDEDYKIRDFSVQIKGGRKQLKNMQKSASSANLKNMALTTVEGIGLGVLGIGFPDIVMFIGVLLKGIYETSLHYGYDYEMPEERMFILKMMETALSKGDDWKRLNDEVDELLSMKTIEQADETVIKKQIDKTARAFAMDMLVLKFIQGLPIVGVLGGTGNPVYYNKVMQYVKVKYQKRYLLNLKNSDVI